MAERGTGDDRWYSPSGPPNRQKPAAGSIALFWVLLVGGALIVGVFFDVLAAR